MKNSHIIDVIAVVLLLIGGLNWGLVGLFNWNLVMAIFGSTLSHIIFVLVGLSAVYRILMWVKARAK